MHSGDTSGADASSTWPPRFERGLDVLAGFALAFVVLTVLANWVQGWLFGSDSSQIITLLSEIPIFLLLGVLTVLALRVDGVRLRDVGVSRRHARFAFVAVGGIVLAVNVVAAGLAFLAGTETSVGLYAQYTRILDATTALLVVGAVNNYLVTGPIEELAFRGYLQNKLLDSIDGRVSHIRTGLGIVLTAVLFAGMHLPDLMLDDGVALPEAIGGLGLLMATAVLFGVVYELTQNLVLVALLHGIGNWWPLAFDPGPGIWPNYAVVLVLYAVTVWLYRRSRRTQVSSPHRDGTETHTT